jgi:hypothetical protein
MFVERYLPARALHGRRVGGVALSVHWFSSGGDRSHPERSEGWNAEGEGMPPLLNHFNDQRRRHPSETNLDTL